MTQPDDLFEKVDPSPQKSSPRATRPTPTPVPVQAAQYTSARRWPLVVGAGIVVLIGLGVAAFFIIRKSPSPANTSVSNQAQNTATPGATNTAVASDIPKVDPPADRDADGLVDDKEQELGTNLGKADTDGDGLGDGEEVTVYTTDPKRPDTDGDGNVDGAEVKKGYNPKGSGLLLDLNAAKQALPK